MIALAQLLLPLARVITPNLPEAEALSGMPIGDAPGLESAALALAEMFGTAVLLKGGHLEGPDCLDLLVDLGTIHRFVAARIPVAGSHGTGCTLSAAIAALLARGQPLASAVEGAKSYLGQTLRNSYEFPAMVGKPLHSLNQGTTFDENGT